MLREAARVVAGHRRRVGGLLVERDDLAVVVGLDHAEVDASCFGTGIAATVTPAPVCDVLVDHLARVHPVDVVGAEHAHDVGALVVDQVEVLVDRVGRTLEPVRPAAHLGRNRRHVVVEHRREPPRLGDVAVEAVALVLREHDDLQVAARWRSSTARSRSSGRCRRTARPAWPDRSSAAAGACPRRPPGRSRAPSVQPSPRRVVTGLRRGRRTATHDGG